MKTLIAQVLLIALAIPHAAGLAAGREDLMKLRRSSGPTGPMACTVSKYLPASDFVCLPGPNEPCYRFKITAQEGPREWVIISDLVWEADAIDAAYQARGTYCKSATLVKFESRFVEGGLFRKSKFVRVPVVQQLY